MGEERTNKCCVTPMMTESLGDRIIIADAEIMARRRFQWSLTALIPQPLPQSRTSRPLLPFA